jgi:hypothetical protein
MKMFMSALLATQLFFWNVALAKQPCKSTVVGDPQADAPTIQMVDIGNGIALHYVDRGKGTPVIWSTVR